MRNTMGAWDRIGRWTEEMLGPGAGFAVVLTVSGMVALLLGIEIVVTELEGVDAGMWLVAALACITPVPLIVFPLESRIRRNMRKVRRGIRRGVGRMRGAVR